MVLVKDDKSLLKEVELLPKEYSIILGLFNFLMYIFSNFNFDSSLNCTLLYDLFTSLHKKRGNN